MTKLEYQINRKLKRRWERHPLLYITDMQKIIIDNAKTKTYLITSQIYQEEDKECECYNLKTNKWTKSIIKKNKETKEEFEFNKAIAICDIWVGLAMDIIKVYNFETIDKQITTKDYLISCFINQLNKLKGG